MSVPYSSHTYEAPIEALALSVRAGNALMRTGLFTVGQVIGAIENETLSRIRNLGKKTENEIKTKVFLFGYEELTEEEKLRFFEGIIEKNACLVEVV